MFIQNKYKKWYDSIILNARIRLEPIIGYSEIHHIVPRSLGGNNSAENMITLTAREHFVCHVLLTKFTIGTHKHKMLYAANMISQSTSKHQNRYLPKSKLYEMIKREFGVMHSARLTGRKLTQEHKDKISEAGKGRINSQETIDKRRLSCTGKVRSPEQKEKMSRSQINRKEKTLTEKETIALKLSNSLKGKNTGPKTTDHKEKIAKSLLGKYKGVAKSEITKQRMRKPKTEEHKKAISDARKAKYAAIKKLAINP